MSPKLIIISCKIFVVFYELIILRVESPRVPPIFTLNMCTLADNKSVSLHWSQKVLWNIEKKPKC